MNEDIRKNYAGLPVMALTLAAALATGGALATSGAASEAQARYQQERAACLAGESGQDRETCLREAGAAYAAARQGKLERDNEDYARNALKRCLPLPDEERLDCEARMRGLGTTSGSVASGGILRQLVTVEVEPVVADPSSRK
jgi:hypothetical protein